MSHFTVLVIGENPEDQLQPFHEYECTGIKDQYVKFTPVKDLKEDYAEYVKEKGKEKSTEIMTFDEYAEDQGYEEQNGEWGRVTNPDAQWDWYLLGGRWTGFLKMKPKTIGRKGEPGIMTDPAKAGRADQAYKRDIDFEGMREEAVAKAEKVFEYVLKVIGDTPVNKTWKEMQGLFEKIEDVREAYWAQPRCVAFLKDRKNRDSPLGWSASPDDYLMTREEYIQQERDGAIHTFAVVKDSTWYEKGDMGWWGMVSDEKDPGAWNREFNKFVDEASDDTLFSVYDCHI